MLASIIYQNKPSLTFKVFNVGFIIIHATVSWKSAHTRKSTQPASCSTVLDCWRLNVGYNFFSLHMNFKERCPMLGCMTNQHWHQRFQCWLQCWHQKQMNTDIKSSMLTLIPLHSTYMKKKGVNYIHAAVLWKSPHPRKSVHLLVLLLAQQTMTFQAFNAGFNSTCHSMYWKKKGVQFWVCPTNQHRHQKSSILASELTQKFSMLASMLYKKNK